MANYVLKNGTLTTFSGTQDNYSMQTTSGNGYAKSNVQQVFSGTSAYAINGSLHINANSGSYAINIMIFDTNGVPMSNTISYGGTAVNGGVTVPISGTLIPTKTAIGEIRITLNCTLSVTGFYVCVDIVVNSETAQCQNCLQYFTYAYDSNDTIILPKLCPNCGIKWYAITGAKLVGRPMKGASVVLVGKSC